MATNSSAITTLFIQKSLALPLEKYLKKNSLTSTKNIPLLNNYSSMKKYFLYLIFFFSSIVLSQSNLLSQSNENPNNSLINIDSISNINYLPSINCLTRVSVGYSISLNPFSVTNPITDKLATLNNKGFCFQFAGTFFVLQNFGLEFSISTIYNSDFLSNKNSFNSVILNNLPHENLSHEYEIKKISLPKD